jgi:hypothetical protein
MAMVLSCHPSMSLLQLLLFSLLLVEGSATALPLQVDRVNQRGASLGLVMSYMDEATALEASSYFTPWHVLPFVDLYGKHILGHPFFNPSAYLFLPPC